MLNKYQMGFRFWFFPLCIHTWSWLPHRGVGASATRAEDFFLKRPEGQLSLIKMRVLFWYVVALGEKTLSPEGKIIIEMHGWPYFWKYKDKFYGILQKITELFKISSEFRPIIPIFSNFDRYLFGITCFKILLIFLSRFF